MKKYIYIVFSFLLLFNIQTKGQFSPIWTANYQHTNNFNYSNESRRMVKDASGNIFVLADATSDIDPNGIQGSTIYNYTILLKYNPSGSLIQTKVINVFSHQINGYNTRSAFGISIGTNGFIFIGYCSYDAATGYNINLSKYNPLNLVRLWNYSYKPTGDDVGIEIAPGPTGNLFCIAKSVNTYHLLRADTTGIDSTSLFTFDPNVEVINSLTVASNGEIFVTGYSLIGGIKNALTAGIKNNGTLKWKKYFNGGTIPRDDIGKQIILGTDNNIYVVGTSDRGTPDNTDIMVLSYYIGNGKFRWSGYFDYNDGYESGLLLKQADPNNLYAAGISGNSVFITRFEMNSGAFTGYGIYNPNPVEPHNSLNGVTVSQIAVSASKSIYLTGNIAANDAGNLPFSAVYLAKFTPETGRSGGMQVFKFMYEHPAIGNHANSYTSSDLILDAGYSRAYLLRDHITDFTNHSEEEIDLVAYNISTPLRTMEQTTSSKEDIHIGPNPAIDYLEVSTAGNIREITLTDYSGRIVHMENFNQTSVIKLDVSTFSDGLYFLKITFNDGTENTKKILLQ